MSKLDRGTIGSKVLVALGYLADDPGKKTVVCFLSDQKRRVRVTRIRRGEDHFIVTIGRYNYAEREFVKSCKRAHTLPKPLWFRPFPQKRKAA